MPITSSAKKALRSSKRKRVFNLRRKNAMAEAIKEVTKNVNDKSPEKVKELLSKAYKAIDKAAKRKVISKNKAARKKSQMTAILNK